MRSSAWLAFLAACAPASPPNAAVRAPAPAVLDPCASPGRWHSIAPLELPGRVDHTAVWSGTEMLLWGGTQGARSPMGDGARYDPATDRWHAMSQTSAPEERDDHAAVWTGREMIVWGGNHDSEKRDKLDSGGRYDPVTDLWSPLPDAGLTARDDPRAVWTGREMIVWGGRDDSGHTRDGARYAPSSDRWRAVSMRGAPESREDHTAVWTGREMIVWGGWNGDDDARNYALDGGRYDPATDRWRPISRVGAPESREDHIAIWTGREMIVWGGVRREPGEKAPIEADKARPEEEAADEARPEEEAADEARPDDDAADDEVAKAPRRGPDRHQLATGGRYDPATDRWTTITLTGAPDPREDGVVVWTGTDMLVWGGQEGGVPMASGARYVASADTWCPIAGDGAPAARRDHAGVWTGRELVVWGGREPDGEYAASGAAFAP